MNVLMGDIRRRRGDRVDSVEQEQNRTKVLAQNSATLRTMLSARSDNLARRHSKNASHTLGHVGLMGETRRQRHLGRRCSPASSKLLARSKRRRSTY
jgi:hypothetical protein